MSAATSNLHDQFHAMLQNMKQAPAPAVLPAPTQPILSGGALSPLPAPPGAGSGVVAVPQKDNIGTFFKKHWGKILALCIIVVVVTVFVARYFISKRKKNRKLKEAHQDQENIQWEQYFGGEDAAAAPQIASSAPPQQPPQQQLPQAQQQLPQPQQQQQLPQAQGSNRPSQRGVPPQIQQIQAQLANSAQAQAQAQVPPQPQANRVHQTPQQQVPPLSAVQQPPPQPQQAPQQQQQAPPQQPRPQPQAPAPAAPVDPRLAAAGISLPQRQAKEKEADIPKADTDQRGKPVEPVQPVGKVIDDIVIA